MFAKSVRDRALPTLVAGAGLLFYVGFALGIYSGFDQQIVDLFADMPDALAALYGTSDKTVAGLVTGALFALLGPLVVVGFAIASGTGAAVGEEKANTLDLLLSNPLSRSRVLGSKAAVVVLAVVTIAALLWLGTVGFGATFGMDLTRQNVLAASVHLTGLALMFGFLAFGLSAWSSRGGIGSGVAAGVAVGSWLATSLLPLTESLSQVAKFTPWYLYSGGDPLVNGVDLVGLGAMLAAAAACFGLGLIGLNRRDLEG